MTKDNARKRKHYATYIAYCKDKNGRDFIVGGYKYIRDAREVWGKEATHYLRIYFKDGDVVKTDRIEK